MERNGDYDKFTPVERVEGKCIMLINMTVHLFETNDKLRFKWLKSLCAPTSQTQLELKWFTYGLALSMVQEDVPKILQIVMRVLESDDDSSSCKMVTQHRDELTAFVNSAWIAYHFRNKLQKVFCP